MEIRSLKATDDRLAVSQIYEKSWKSAYRGIVPQSYLDSIPAGRWAPTLEQAGRTTLVMEEGGQLIGTSSVCASRWPDYSGFGEIVSLYLLPEHMGKGYGKALLDAAIQTLAGQGFQDVLLWVLEGNRRARAFYEKSGFRLGRASMENTIGGKPLREILYLFHIE